MSQFDLLYKYLPFLKEYTGKSDYCHKGGINCLINQNYKSFLKTAFSLGLAVPDSKKIYSKYEHLTSTELKEKIPFLCFKELRGILGGILFKSIDGEDTIMEKTEDGTLYLLVSYIEKIDNEGKIKSSEYRESGNHSIDIDKGISEKSNNLSTKKIRNHFFSNYFSVYSMVILGLAIIIASDYIIDVLAYVVGISMVLISVINAILRLSSKKTNIDTKAGALSRAIIFGVLGFLMIFIQENSLIVIGVAWGVYGLIDGGIELKEVIEEIYYKRKFIFDLLYTLTLISLSMLLIFYPESKIHFHIIILGLEIIVDSFKGFFGNKTRTTIA